MNLGRLVFTQTLDQLHREQFDRCVSKYPMQRKSKSFSARDQFLCMGFAQLTFRESLRDIEACLRSQENLLHAMGVRGSPTRTNLAYANENRDWRVFEQVAASLVRKAKKLYSNNAYIKEIDAGVYALDSSTIDLCLSLFPWAPFQQSKSAVKLHTSIDLRGSIPVFIAITDAKTHDSRFLDLVPFEPGSFYVMDRGYIDFTRLSRIDEASSFFVVRARSNMLYYVRGSRPVDKSTGLRCDQTIRLTGYQTKKRYLKALRRVSYWDEENAKLLVFVTNNFTVDAEVIAKAYKSRWQIELFFKWIKQNLRIKSFYGYSENAVKTQIWIAISVYLMIAILKKELGITQSMSRILQVISVNVFSKVPISELLTGSTSFEEEAKTPNQLVLNGF